MAGASSNAIVEPFFDEALRSGWARGRENATRVELVRGGYFIYLVPRVATISIAVDPRLKAKAAHAVEREDMKHSGLEEFPDKTGLKLKALPPSDFGKLLRTLP
jgi:hypothetical protein